MPKQTKINESWNVQYYARDGQTSDDILNLQMNWENRSTEEVMKNLNIWLTAINIPLKVVNK
jgi:hypothetical protein